MDYFPDTRPPAQKTFKFRRASLLVEGSDQLKIKKFALRRFHIGKLWDFHFSDQNIAQTKFTKHQHLQRKTLNTLQDTTIYFLRELNWLHDLKDAKNLKRVWLKIGKEDLQAIPGFPDLFSRIDFILRCLKRFSKKITFVSLQIEGISVEKGQLTQIYRILSSMRNLEKVRRLFGFDKEGNYIKLEQHIMRKYLSHCSNLFNFEYNPIEYQKECWEDDNLVNFPSHARQNQIDYHKQIQEIRPNPFVTFLNLQVNGRYFENYDELEPHLYEELSDTDLNEEFELEPNTTTDVNLAQTIRDLKPAMTQTIAPFFKFDVFPNLVLLVLDFRKRCLYHLDDFLIKSFSSLKLLKQFDLILPKRPIGTKFLFEAFLHLPLLDRFRLDINSIKVSEWTLFSQFLQKQSQLIVFMLKIKKERSCHATYLSQEKFIQLLAPLLSNKPRLKYLYLDLIYTSLSTISKLLQQSTLPSQLTLLDLEAFDDTVTGTASSQGLCEFLSSQKDSLKSVNLKIKFTVNSEAIGAVCSRISELRSLEELSFQVNFIYEHEKKKYIQFLESACKTKNPIIFRPKVKNYQSWYSQLSKTLKKLPNINKLNLQVGRLTAFDDRFVKEFLSIINVLAFIKSLRVLQLNIPFSKLTTPAKNQLKSALFELKNVAYLCLGLEDLACKKVIPEFQSLVNQFNQKQSLEAPFMFLTY